MYIFLYQHFAINFQSRNNFIISIPFLKRTAFSFCYSFFKGTTPFGSAVHFALTLLFSFFTLCFFCSFSKGTALLIFVVPIPKEHHFSFLLFLFQRNGICVFYCSFSKGTTLLIFVVPFPKEQHLCFLLFLFQSNSTFDFCCSFSKGTAFVFSDVPFSKERHF